MYDTVHVPSLLSTHLISVFEGPSIARDKPPVNWTKIEIIKQCFRQILFFSVNDFGVIG